MTALVMIIFLIGAVLGLRLLNAWGLMTVCAISATTLAAGVLLRGESVWAFVQLTAIAVASLQTGWLVGVITNAALRSLRFKGKAPYRQAVLEDLA
jgi:hypothetical protein